MVSLQADSVLNRAIHSQAGGSLNKDNTMCTFAGGVMMAVMDVVSRPSADDGSACGRISMPHMLTTPTRPRNSSTREPGAKAM